MDLSTIQIVHMRIQMKTTTVTMMIGVIGEMIGVIGEVREVREMGKKGETGEAEEAASTTTVATVGRWEGGVKGAKEVSASQTCLEMAATVLRLLRLLARGVVAMAAKTGAEVVLITVITVMA
jgi:hypothetical protein